MTAPFGLEDSPPAICLKIQIVALPMGGLGLVGFSFQGGFLGTKHRQIVQPEIPAKQPPFSNCLLSGHADTSRVSVDLHPQHSPEGREELRPWMDGWGRMIYCQMIGEINFRGPTNSINATPKFAQKILKSMIGRKT